MSRYFLNISYLGTNYHGWQVQANAHTVQAELEQCLSKILRQHVVLMGSGRTDTGVHARQQVAHFEIEKELDTLELVYKLNGILPDDISIGSCLKVRHDAHARFDASERGYKYFIHWQKSPFLCEQSYYYTFELDVEIMNKAAEHLIGEQNFESFSKVKTEVNNFICTVHKADWSKENDQLVFHVRANRFLRGMVRALVGTLLEVGRKKLSVTEFVNIIEAKDRKRAGRAVPPHGLFLTEVNYPQDIYL